jgi:hypothetical protein
MMRNVQGKQVVGNVCPRMRADASERNPQPDIWVKLEERPAKAQCIESIGHVVLEGHASAAPHPIHLRDRQTQNVKNVRARRKEGGFCQIRMFRAKQS